MPPTDTSATGIEAVSSYTPGYRLAPELAAGLRASPDVPLAAPDEDVLTLTWEALRALPDDRPRERVALPAGGAVEQRALAAHLEAAGGIEESSLLLPLAAGTGSVAAVATAARAHADVAVLVDHGRPGEHTAPPSREGSLAVRFGAPRVARILGTASHRALSYDRFPATSETDGNEDPRFVEETLVAKDGTHLLERLCADAGLMPRDLAGVVVNCGVPLRAARWARQWEVKNVWTPGAPELRAGRLAASTLDTALRRLAEAGPGALVAVLDLGWGGDAMLLRAGEEVGSARHEVARPAAIPDIRNFRSRAETPEGTGIWTSPAKLRREAPELLRLTGHRDAGTGAVAFPYSWSHDGLGSGTTEPVPLARTGSVLSHNLDRLFAPGRDVQMIVVELDGGGRFFGQSVAAPRRWAEVGDRVRLLLRRLHSGNGLPHYFWKVDLDDEVR